MRASTLATCTCVHLRCLALAYTNTHAPEQNSIINGLIARVELLWESEPATLNKIKPLLYIFIIPNRVLNCKCISEIHRCPSLLSSLSFPPFPCCLTTAALSTFHTPPPPCPLPHQLHVCLHARAHAHTCIFYCVCARVCVCAATIKQSY